MADEKDFMLTDDMLIDDIEDLPSFECWPSGMYSVVLSQGIIETEIADAPYFKAPLTLTAPGVDVEGQPTTVAVGSELELLFQRGNKFGAANYKTFVRPIAQKMGVSKVSEVNEGCKGMELTILLNKRQSKRDKTKFFPQVMEVMVA